MAIHNLILEEFSVFEKAEFSFSPGLNILLGANSTGKTHLMKLLYSCLKACKRFGKNADLNESKLATKLSGVFKTRDDEIGLLVRRGADPRMATVKLYGSGFSVDYRIFGKSSTSELSGYNHDYKAAASLFIPTSEMLSSFEGFVSAYEKRELSYDETYYDLCVALDGSSLKGTYANEASAILNPLIQVWPGDVSLENGAFYVTIEGDGKYAAHQLSEGYRKLATIIQLIKNGSIMEGSILFWDEPASNMNPKLVGPLAKLLMSLATAGVQVFISTHDYLLSNELSMHAEYQTKEAKKANIKFFGLYKEKPGKPVLFDTGGTLNDLDNNLIQEEFAAHYDREKSLFFGDDNSANKNGNKK